eukprot:TRINITY_DN44529_c0_g1_i1.p1 TRINITY_DN44529_c0_g1~~TRINITY_DN44529_c0_g1_i1.p1  ORF type:complete len:1236 (-),score=232.53 TRINITY_DN44529_c0_g1_i1:190-3897(-)
MASAFAWPLMAWIFPTLRQGLLGRLGPGDELLQPLQYRAEAVFGNFHRIHVPGRQVVQTLWLFYRRDLCICIVIGMLSIVSKLGGTLLIRAITQIVLDKNNGVDGTKLGLVYSGLLFACSIVDSICTPVAGLRLCALAVGVAATFATVTYEKAKVLHPFARENHKRGDLVSLACSDCARLIDTAPVAFMGLMAPLQVLFSIITALWLVGSEAVVILAWSVLLSFSMNRIGKMQAGYFRDKLKHQGARLTMFNEMLQSMKMVKMGAWEEYFEGALGERRRLEEKQLKKTRYANAMLNPLCALLTPLSILSVFVLRLVFRGELPSMPDTFALVHLLRTMEVPLTFLGIGMGALAMVQAACGRLTVLLSRPNLDSRKSVVDAAADGPCVEVNAGNFAWTEGTPTLQDVSLSVQRGQLIFIVGHLGQGKSSLLEALLGEMDAMGAATPPIALDRSGGVAYTPQQACVMNETLRENVLFGKELEQERYEAALSAAGLDVDLKLLPGGDLTEIGEKGVTLSGGQRARVGLARLAYAQPNLALMDDPLAALDMEVGRHVFEELLCGTLAGTTRLVVSSQVHMLADSRVNRVIVVSKGHIVEDGTFGELSQPGTILAELLQFSSTALAEHEPVAKTKEQIPQPAPNKKSSLGGGVSRITVDEEKRQGAVMLRTVLTYAKYVGVWTSAYSVALCWAFCFGTMSPDVWLSLWEEDVFAQNQEFYVGTWVAIIVVGVLLMIGSRFNFSIVTVRAATKLHREQLHSILMCPLLFFEQTPSGRIMNRFGEDQNQLDMQLGLMMEAVFILVFKSANILIIILWSAPWAAIVLVAICPPFWMLVRYLRATMREAARFWLMTKSPVFSGIEETLAGLSAIRAFGAEHRLRNKFFLAVDLNGAWCYTRNAANFWAEQRLLQLVALLVVTSSVVVVLMRKSVVPSVATLGLVYVTLFGDILRLLANVGAQVEALLTTVERAQELLSVAHEAPRKMLGDEVTSDGAAVVFESLKLKYQPDLPPSLRGVSFEIQSGERVGIVGRSGSGKSTLFVALLRLVEPSEGRIFVGGRDISAMGLQHLRSLITVIPQDPVMFGGHVRGNLDPTSAHSDEALQRSCKSTGLPNLRPSFSLEELVQEGGSNFSVGERQLLCMARALLRRNPVMLFDEATASMDVESDARLQAVLRRDFAESTILTVAHRIGTIVDYDRILALSCGVVAEFASPKELMATPGGTFYGLAKEAGLLPGPSDFASI